MTFADFQEHMARLVAQFGPQAYSTERLKLFYRELQGTDVRIWERVVDTLLGEARYAPMLPEIREHVSRERERIHAREKLEHKRDAEEAWRALTSEEAQFFFGNMKARIRGEMPDQDFAAFTKLLAKFRSGGES